MYRVLGEDDENRGERIVRMVTPTLSPVTC